jgi:DNA-binding transcriptional LysR family regulator
LITREAALPELHSQHLFDESYVCALRADHPDATARALSIDRFCALDHALVSFSGERFWASRTTRWRASGDVDVSWYR